MNDAPVVSSNVLTVNEGSADTSLGLTAPTDVDSDSLTITVTGLPSLGVVTLADGSTAVTASTTLTSPQLIGLLYDAPSEYDGIADAGAFTYEVSDGDGATSTATATINITAVNDAPEVTAGGTLAYTENDAATPIDDGIALSDADDTQLEGATVAITSGFVSGEDSLSFANQNGITGSYNAATGILTLSGTATVAAYETALQSVAYANSSDAPSGADREITFTVSDGDVDSSVATSTVTVAAVNDAPIIDTGTSDLSGVLTSFIEDRLPNTSAASETPTAIRQPIVWGGSYSSAQEKFAGIAIDPVTGKFFESVGTQDYGESAVHVFADAAAFEAGTILTTLSLGSSTDVYGTYFTAYNDVLIGKSGLYQNESTEIAFWSATNGAVLNEIIPIPGVLTLWTSSSYGFNWGGATSINLIQDSTGIYALGKTTGSTWALAEIDPVSQTVVGTEFFNVGVQGFAFAVEGLIFFGNYNTGYVSRVYNIETNILSNVNISLGALGGSNDYWSNMSYDSATDTLYMVNSPTNSGGAIYKIENISDLVLTPSMLPAGTIGFDDPDTTNVFPLHDVTVSEPDSTPYLGSLTVGVPIGTSATEYEVSWEYQISQQDYDSLAAGQTITENFEVTINDGGPNGTDSETVTIVTTGINDAPEVTAGGTLAYTENDAATPIDDGIALSDADDTQLEGATVAITSGFVSGEDSLSFANQNGITGSYNAATGILTLSGTATVAAYETALQSVAYANSSDAPSGADREITFTVSDGDVDSSVATSTVTVAAVNDAPVITGFTNGSVVEDSFVKVATGDLDYTDVDDDIDDAWFVPSEVEGIYGNFGNTSLGVWTYTIDNTKLSVNALGSDTAVSETFNVEIADSELTQTVTINIQGANDAAVISIANLGTGTETGAGTSSYVTMEGGDLDHTDVDANNIEDVWIEEPASDEPNSDNGYGNYTVSEAGVWTYTVDRSNSDVTGLSSSGDTFLDDSFTIYTKDDTPVTFTVNIQFSTGVSVEPQLPLENIPFEFTAYSLLANDLNAETATITATSAFSAKGATIRLSAGNVTYDPTTSPSIDELATGESLTDTFEYTITDGGQSRDAIFTVAVNGFTDEDAAPIWDFTEMDGFAVEDPGVYAFELRADGVEMGEGLTYILHDGTTPIDAPAGVTFNEFGFAKFTFTDAAETDYTDGLGVYAYEADGQSIYVEVGYSVDEAGDLLFFYTDFAPADGGPVLEIASVENGLVDLSGIHTLTDQGGPLENNMLASVSVLDLENGQGDSLTLTADDLLRLIAGNTGSDNEFITIKMDDADTVMFDDDNNSNNEGDPQGWVAVVSSTTLNQYSIDKTDSPSEFDAYAGTFATIFIDFAQAE